jgi:hypothetical protein
MTPLVLRIVEGHLGTAFLVIVLAGSLALNVTLGWRLSEVRTKPTLGDASIGIDALPDISAISASGQRVTLPMSGGRPKVIFVLSPHCRWCVRNYANLLAIADARRDEYQLLAVLQDTDLNGLRTYLTAYPLPFEAFLLGPEPARHLTRATPSTLVVDAAGRVEAGWEGAFIGARAKEVQRFFNVALPDSTSK